MKRHINTFTGGMSQDLDNQLEKPNTYLYSLNGKVIFNADNGTYAWENAKGNTLAFTINADYGNSGTPVYYPIGTVEVNGKLLVFSTAVTLTTPANSEIGLVSQNQYGVFTYQTIFNDKYDPNGDLLNFDRKHQILAKAVVESVKIERSYWDDDNNVPRAFNILSGLQKNNPEFVDGDYNPLTATGKYPAFYSVHSMSSTIDLTWGLLKYERTLNSGGNLTTARYQYAYRYVHKSGYASVWSVPINFVTLALNEPGGSGLRGWQDYNLAETGAATTKAIELSLKYLDTRFQYVEIAAVQWYTDSAFNKAVVIGRFDIPANGELKATHRSMTGVEITIDDILQRYITIAKAKTDVIKDNSLLKMNLVEFPQLQLPQAAIDGITIKPKVRQMLSDLVKYPDADQSFYPPLTGAGVYDTLVDYNLFNSFTEKYRINSEYINYKGTQWEHLFTGYMRDERYRFGIVIFDMSGQPCYVQHVADFKFPKQFDNIGITAKESGFSSDTYGNAGDYVLTIYDPSTPTLICEGDDSHSGVYRDDAVAVQILGAEFNGIRIPNNILFDANGRLQVSGFSIVRCDIPRTIISQGLLLNTVRDSPASIGFGHNSVDYKYNNGTGASSSPTRTAMAFADKTWKTARPLPTMYNWYGGTFSGGNSISLVNGDAINLNDYMTPPDRFGFDSEIKTIYAYGDDGLGNDIGDLNWRIRQTQNNYIGWLNKRVSNSNVTFPVITADSVFTFESPDVFMDSSILNNSLSNSKVELVGICAHQSPQAGRQIGYGTHIYNDSGIYGENWAGYPDANQFYGKYPYTLYVNDPLIENNLDGAATISNGAMLGTSEEVSLVAVEVSSAAAFNGYDYSRYSTITGYHTIRPYMSSSAQSHPNTCLLALKDKGNIRSTSLRKQDALFDEFGGYNAWMYYLANYKQENNDYTLTETQLSQDVYRSIGHFVPINKSILQNMGVTPTSGTDAVFDNVEVWGGDTYTDYFSYLRLEPVWAGIYYDNYDSDGGDKFDDYDWNLGTEKPPYPDYSVGMTFPVECRNNFMMRAADTYDIVGTKYMAVGAGENVDFQDGYYWSTNDDKKEEEFLANKVFLAKDVSRFNVKDDFYTSDETDFPTKEIYSETKVYGEAIDSFRQFKVNSFAFADGQYGEITHAELLLDRVYAIQRTAFCYVPFNERTVIAGGAGGNISVGGGEGLAYPNQYINNKIGSQHQWSIANSGKAIYGVDAFSGKAWRFSQAGMEMLSDTKGMHNWFQDKLKEYWKIRDTTNPNAPFGIDDNAYNNYDNPCYYGGISSVWDNENGSVYWTFASRLCRATLGIAIITETEGTPQTIEYNENDDTFKSFYSFTPNLYAQFKGQMYSIASGNDRIGVSGYNKANEFYLHNYGQRGNFYGQVFNSELKFVVNPNIPYSKTFDNIRLNVNEQAITSNSLQQCTGTTELNSAPHVLTFATDYRPEYREGFYVFPIIGLTNDDRLYGKYLTVDYLISNASNSLVRFTDNETQYRPSQMT